LHALRFVFNCYVTCLHLLALACTLFVLCLIVTLVTCALFVFCLIVKPRLHDGDTIFWKIVVSSGRSENGMCSHPRTGDTTDEKIAEKIARNSMS